MARPGLAILVLGVCFLLVKSTPEYFDDVKLNEESSETEQVINNNKVTIKIREGDTHNQNTQNQSDEKTREQSINETSTKNIKRNDNDNKSQNCEDIKTKRYSTQRKSVAKRSFHDSYEESNYGKVDYGYDRHKNRESYEENTDNRYSNYRYGNYRRYVNNQRYGNYPRHYFYPRRYYYPGHYYYPRHDYYHRHDNYHRHGSYHQHGNHRRHGRTFGRHYYGNVRNTNQIITEYNRGKSNPDIDLNIVELLTKYGHKVSTYWVETEDGYLLTVYRVKGHHEPVFLMHGLLCSADDFVTPGPESGLAYLLAAQGYDVWLGNARGNVHSRAHRRLSPDSSDFWQFSWDEIGRFDLPAMVDLVLRVTARPQLKYVGHSQGTTSFFVMCSMRPEYNKKISLMVALSAVAFTSHLKSPVIRLLSPINPLLAGLFKLIGKDEFLPRHDFLMTLVGKHLCGTEELPLEFCTIIQFILSGFDYAQVNATNLPVLYSHTPAGAATNQLVHYGQGVVSGEFRRFDYGAQNNLLVYGSLKPPSYPLKRVTAPVAIFYSEGDWLASVRDVNTLRTKLANVVDFHKIPLDQFNHMDFLWAKDLKDLVFKRLLYLFRNY